MVRLLQISCVDYSGVKVKLFSLDSSDPHTGFLTIDVGAIQSFVFWVFTQLLLLWQVTWETCAAQQPRIDKGMWATISGRQHKTWVQVVSAYTCGNEEENFVETRQETLPEFILKVQINIPSRSPCFHTWQAICEKDQQHASANTLTCKILQQNGFYPEKRK